MNIEKWLAERRKGLGGTDMSAILGLNKFSSPHKVFLDKLNLSENIDNDAMYWGRAKEPIVAEKWTENHPEFEVRNPEKLFYWEKNPIFLGTPDRLLYVNGKLVDGLEIKTTSERLAWQWGEAGTDEVPDMYNIQCQHYMMIMGFDRWHLGVLIGSADYREYVIYADPTIQEAMVDEGVVFWERVVNNDPPPVDASDGSKIFLNKWYKDRKIEEPIVATIEIEALIKNRSVADSHLKSAKNGIQECDNKIKEFMGDCAILTGINSRITWKQSKDRKKIDWELIAREIFGRWCDPNNSASFDMIVSSHTKQSTPARTFRVTMKKEEV